MPRDNFPLYPPRVEAAIAAFHNGQIIREAEDSELQPATLTDVEVVAELQPDFWRSLMDADDVDDRATSVA